MEIQERENSILEVEKNNEISNDQILKKKSIDLKTYQKLSKMKHIEKTYKQSDQQISDTRNGIKCTVIFII